MRRALLIGVAAAAAVLPVPRSVVERAYSTGLYAIVQPLITSASNRLAVALFDVLLVIATVWFAVAVALVIRSARRTGWLRSLGRLLLWLATAAAVFYLAFLVLWGWNYRRVPLAAKLDYQASRVTGARVLLTAHAAVDSLNRLHDAAHAGGWATPGFIDPGLAGAFGVVQVSLGARRPAVPARPKATLLEPYFRRTGVSGMTDPYFLETLVDDTLLPYERPFVVAHEWAHLAGYADEGEANFVGWLTCVRAREPEQYSGWLFLYEELARTAAARDRGELSAALSDGVRMDMRAIGDRLRRNVNPSLAMAGWRVYDNYLKANRVAEGAASYETVVRLVLGVNFGPAWTPQRRP